MSRIMPRGLGVLLLATGLCWSDPARSAERLYRCEQADGIPLFSNRPQLGCPVYEPQASLPIVQEGTTWEEIRVWFRGASDRQPMAPAPPSTNPASSAICQAYRDWVALNLRTHGGTWWQSPEDRTQWVALARTFSLIGVPPACP